MMETHAHSSAQPAATVLVADDDEDLRRAMASVLAAEGYRVIEAADGDTALALLADSAASAEGLPDLLLLDFTMPGFSGLGVLRALRRMARPPPTLLITAFPHGSVETFARALGVERVLRKPIDADVLLAAVLEALKGRHARRLA